MPLHTTLTELVEMVRAEAKLSTNSSRGTDHAEYLKALVKRHYRMIAEEYDWAHLRVVREDAGKDIQAGLRYYDLPTTVNPERLEAVWTKHSDNWLKLEYGIDPTKYNEIDSDRNQRYDPPLQWQWYGDRQIEIWPLPASDLTNGLRFEGGKAITLLNSPSARADIDDILIVLSVAAEILQGNKQADAEVKNNAFIRRLATLKGTRRDRTRVQVGIGMVEPTYEVPRISVAYTR